MWLTWRRRKDSSSVSGMIWWIRFLLVVMAVVVVASETDRANVDERESEPQWRVLAGEPTTPEPSASPSQTPITSSPSKVRSFSPSAAPSKVPTSTKPSWTPSQSPITNKPTQVPTKSPSASSPTSAPSKAHVTAKPTNSPSSVPTRAPTKNPTQSPTHSSPSKIPSTAPTKSPITTMPSRLPSKSPATSLPTASPSRSPTTGKPSSSPSRSPTTTSPSFSPSRSPTTSKPTYSPSHSPTSSKPTLSPSSSPTTSKPTQNPTTSRPSFSPSRNPTISAPSRSPTVSAPTHSPSRTPTRSPTTSRPSHAPSKNPSKAPTTSAPTLSPTESPVPFFTQNVLLIIVDDLRNAVGSFGDQDARTPNIDRLTQRGLRFINHHVQVSECAPSRVSMLTGRRPDQTLIFSREPYFRRKNHNLLTLPAYFRNLNYTSVGLGKIFDTSSFSDSKNYNYEYTDYCHANTPSDSSDCSFDIEVPPAIQGQDLMRCPNRSFEFPLAPASALFSQYGESFSVIAEQEMTWYDGCTALQAISRLEEFGQAEQPFFLSLGFLRPHLPWSAPQRFWKMYPSAQTGQFASRIHRKDISNRQFFKKQSQFASQRKGWDELKQWEKTKAKRRPGNTRPRAYYVAVAFVDELIGRVVAAVETSPYRFVRDNTVIVLWGDNGMHLGPLLWGKKTLFEKATLTPLVVVPSAAWKRKQNQSLVGLGAAIAFPVESIDIYPTILELTGVPMLPAAMGLTGKSLVPYFFNTTQSLKMAAISQYRDQRNSFKTNRMGYAVRTENYRLIKYFQFDPKCHGQVRSCMIHKSEIKMAKAELYYYPYPGAPETTNVFKSAAHRAGRQLLEAIMRNRTASWSSL